MTVHCASHFEWPVRGTGPHPGSRDDNPGRLQRHRVAAIGLVTGAILSGVAAAAAQTAAPSAESDESRYIYNRVQDGFIRLDTRNGQVSLCGRRAVGWTCEAVPEERTALEAEIARLQKDNAALKKELLSRGLDLPGTMKPDAPAPQAKARDPEIKLPSQAELDRVMSFMESVWRRMVEMIANLQKDAMKKN
ncbi:MAG: hypothetical protein AB7K04_03910 [Pseudorhodoplanes sp.]